MKTQYAPSFVLTLMACALTPQEWRVLSRHRYTRRRTRSIRQFVRKVQQVHTGQGRWIRGHFVKKGT